LITSAAKADLTKNFIFETDMKLGANLSATEAIFIGLKGSTGFVTSGVDYPNGDGTMTEAHAGFIISSTSTLYASVSDGTTQNKIQIDVDGYTLTTYIYYRIVRIGSSIKFYINGVLKQTLTTNLPDDTTCAIAWIKLSNTGNLYYVKQNWKYEQDI